jgi:DNA-directed RNA polymerase specialized sigma24 family protein
MGIHLFCYTHGGERATSHDVVQDVFASIVKMYGLLHGNNPFLFSFTSS